ncbi:MAG: hypothetical protein EOO08_02735 [Chitinophagaceae bacterium]|nr:MAG: hypothetical protein EOO08_02735 [Chitinophagaceae bacterium]
MQIAAFNRKPLHNGEVITFYTRTLETIPDAGLPASVLSARNVLQSLLHDMSGAHVALGASEHTQEAQELDAARDEQFSGLVLQCRAQAQHKDPARRRAAQLLLARIGDYGTISEFTLQPFADESADISSLSRDIRESNELRDAAALTGATDFLDELHRLNSEFERVVLTRSAEATGNGPSLTELRPMADKAYNTLCQKINSYCITEEGAEPWPGIINKINRHITEARTQLAARRGRAEAAAAAGQATQPANS